MAKSGRTTQSSSQTRLPLPGGIVTAGDLDWRDAAKSSKMWSVASTKAFRSPETFASQLLL